MEQYKVSKMNEERLSDHFAAKDLDALRPSLRTGDILLFSGTESLFSPLLPSLSPSYLFILLIN